jgi:hypothetical protein
MALSANPPGEILHVYETQVAGAHHGRQQGMLGRDAAAGEDIPLYEIHAAPGPFIAPVLDGDGLHEHQAVGF